MNVDKAMEAAAEFKVEMKVRPYWTLFSETVAVTLVDEVERLRAELSQLRKDWCDDDEAIKQQALRVLDAAKVEGDSVYVPRMGALAEMMADELVKVRAELAVKSLGNSFEKLRDAIILFRVNCATVEVYDVATNTWTNAEREQYRHAAKSGGKDGE